MNMIRQLLVWFACAAGALLAAAFLVTAAAHEGGARAAGAAPRAGLSEAGEPMAAARQTRSSSCC